MFDSLDEPEGQLVIDLELHDSSTTLSGNATERKLDDSGVKSSSRRRSTKRKADECLEGPARKIRRSNRLSGKIYEGMFNEREM